MIRRIKYTDKETGKSLTFLTNNLLVPPETVALDVADAVVTMPQQCVGILAIGSDVEVVGFGFFAHVLLFFV